MNRSFSNLIPQLLLILFFYTSSCGSQHENVNHQEPNQDDMVICTEIFVSITAIINDSDGNPLLLDEAYTIRKKNNERLTFDQPFNNGTYTILDDSFQPTISNSSESFEFIGKLDGKIVVQEEYELGADQCHVFKKSGKEVIHVVI